MNVHEFHATLSIRPTPGDLDNLCGFLHDKVTDSGKTATVKTADGDIQVPVFNGAGCHTVEYKTITSDAGAVTLVLTCTWESDPDDQMLSQVVQGVKRTLDAQATVGHLTKEEPKPATDAELSGKSVKES
jgi:hypothetical protein